MFLPQTSENTAALVKAGKGHAGGVLVGEGRREMVKASELSVIQVHEEDECEVRVVFHLFLSP